MEKAELLVSGARRRRHSVLTAHRPTRTICTVRQCCLVDRQTGETRDEEWLATALLSRVHDGGCDSSAGNSDVCAARLARAGLWNRSRWPQWSYSMVDSRRVGSSDRRPFHLCCL